MVTVLRIRQLPPLLTRHGFHTSLSHPCLKFHCQPSSHPPPPVLGPQSTKPYVPSCARHSPRNPLHGVWPPAPCVPRLPNPFTDLLLCKFSSCSRSSCRYIELLVSCVWDESGCRVPPAAPLSPEQLAQEEADALVLLQQLSNRHLHSFIPKKASTSADVHMARESP